MCFLYTIFFYNENQLSFGYGLGCDYGITNNDGIAICAVSCETHYLVLGGYSMDLSHCVRDEVRRAGNIETCILDERLSLVQIEVDPRVGCLAEEVECEQILAFGKFH